MRGSSPILKTLTIRFSLLLSIISISQTLFSQEEGKIEADRPDQTETPFTTKHKYFQVEVGVGLIKQAGLSTFVLPTILSKYGLTKRIEFRLLTEMDVVETPLLIPTGNKFISGLIPLHVGMKISLWEEKNGLPKTSLLVELGIPRAAKKAFRNTYWAPSILLSFQNTISKNIDIGYNIGPTWNGQSKTPFWNYSTSLGYDLSERWSAFTEWFGAIKHGEKAGNLVDAGFGYFINDNIKIDLSFGAGLSKSAVDWFAGTGIAFRFR